MIERLVRRKLVNRSEGEDRRSLGLALDARRKETGAATGEAGGPK